MTKLLKDRITLITGASRGIGKAVAKRFAAEGAHVIAVARTTGALEELDDEIRELGGSCTIVPLDVREGDAIDQLGATIFQRWGKLDVLVGNAGMLGDITPLAHYDPKIWAQVMEVNVTANYRLLRSMDALLRASDAGRVMMVSSGAANGNFAYWGAYGASKAALESLTLTYANEVANTKLKVNVIDPGIVRTRMRAQAFPGEDPMKLPTPDKITDVFVALASPDCTKHGEVVMAHVKR